MVPPDVPTPGPGTDETPVPTYDVNLKKISAADGNKVIQGAKFKLHNDSLNQWYVWNTGSNQWTFTTDESKATEFSTNASGVINFTRLGAGTYTVKETQVPAGYFSFVKPSFGIHITDDGHVTITGKNQPGLTGTVNNADGKTTTPTAVVKNIDNITQLPQTGATTMGVMLVGAFAIILVATATASPRTVCATPTWATDRPSPDRHIDRPRRGVLAGRGGHRGRRARGILLSAAPPSFPMKTRLSLSIDKDEGNGIPYKTYRRFVAASTLGAGLAGTANAVDAAGAASDTTGAVTTTADDTGGRTVLDCRQSGEGAPDHTRTISAGLTGQTFH